ncbi:histidine kinase [Vagococcus sp. DIV0080]|uniref:histidine kinase n=1 Tax=Candidatus Vagococcus giribetii TaxID=2230876 RepID=A0ABS3HVR8_9ENTE|nr:histidine kinase [Vagococcus sp. DIV0080]MBO0477854.1 histidine kinase [Vagococcus sp. DIV0080]
MKKIKNWLHSNELFFKLLSVVILFVILVCFLTLSLVIERSKNSYIDSYKASNQILMDKIQKDYDTLNDNINRMFDLVDNSQVVEDYLTTKNDHSGTIVEFTKQMQSTRSIFEDTPSNLILIGVNGTTFVQNSGIKNQSAESFLSSPLVEKINESRAISQYFYQASGPTTATKNQSGLLYLRKLTSNEKVFGYALIFVSENHFASIYEELLNDELHTIYVVNDANQIISSNQKNELGLTLSDEFIHSNNKELTETPLYSYHFTLYNAINIQHLVANMNLLKPTILIAILAILLVSLLAFFIIKRTTDPIYQLIDHLPAVTQGDFSNQVDIAGTYETRELGKAYNLMLQDLEGYFAHIIQTEEDKRLIEINSLQLQIQPHFIYNTLTAIKFLIWQNENEKAIEAMDSFIQLLRHTLSNKKEFIPLEHELQGIESYIAILNLRYGDRISVIHSIEEDCQQALVPKMIIQPIIENAYLHAFPNEQEGYIQLFARHTKEILLIEIIDNGIGFQTDSDLDATESKSLHYSGIGLTNIKERIQLLYGETYTLSIDSTPGVGTSITILLPYYVD